MEYNDETFAYFKRRMKQITPWLPEKAESLMDRFYWVVTFGRIVCPEYHFKWPCCEWWQDALFLKFMEKFPPGWIYLESDRKWNMAQLMRLCAHISGDTAECGAWKGAGSWAILKEWEMQFEAGARHHYIFESCEGLSAPGENDGPYMKEGDMACHEEEIKTNLQGYDSLYTLHKGWIPERFQEVKDKRFAFVHIDVDHYQPTRDSIEFFYPRLNPGAIVINDDYGYTTCPGATKAMDEFLADKEEKMVSLSAGGGFFIKGYPTAIWQASPDGASAESHRSKKLK